MSYLVPRGKQHSKRKRVYAIFIGISSCLHGILLGLLFFAYHYDAMLSHITLHKDMPIIKFTPQNAQAPKSLVQPQTMVASNTKIASPVVNSVPKTEPVQDIKEDNTKGTRAALISPVAEKKASKKSAQLKKKKEIKKQKVEPKKKELVKEKIKEEKPALKELVAEKKVAEPKQVEVKEKEQVVQSKEPDQKQAISQNNQVVAQNDEVLPAGSEISQIVIGEIIDDPKLIQYYTQLQNAVSDAWKPPVGISDECICDVLINLDAQGKPKEVKIVKSSGVLIYDIAARNALQDAKMPKWTFGKSITVSFKQ